MAMNNYTSAAYEASAVIKQDAGVLYGLSGYNSKTSAQFIQVFDAATLPADGAAPKLLLRVAADSSFSIGYDELGRHFKAGMVICNSTTGQTKTIGAADCWFDVQFV